MKQSPTATAAYKAFKVDLAGAITEIDAGLSITAEDRLNANQASIEQIKLDAGEKVLFAIHRGTDANPVGEDAINASIHIDLLASQKVIGGKEYYYNLNNGHYLVSSSGEATWSTAATEVELLDLEGNQVYLSTPSDPTSQQDCSSYFGRCWFEIRHGLVAKVLMDKVHGRRPLQADGRGDGNTLSLAGFDSLDLSSSQRYFIEAGERPLPMPAALSDVIAQASNPGNPLIIQQEGVGYSPRTDHSYTVDANTIRFFSEALLEANQVQLEGQNGYLAQINSLAELEIADWFTTQSDESQLWLGLFQTDTSAEPDQVALAHRRCNKPCSDRLYAD